MIKSNLPVILLKGLVLLPYEEVRIELNNEISKKIIDLSNLYHDDEVLIVCPINSLEENPDTSDLPKIGVVGKIKNNILLPNGNNRIVIEGINRVRVYSYVNYSNEKDILESIVEPIETTNINETEETALLRKLFMLVDEYIMTNSNVSNSIMSKIKGLTELDKLTDIIASFMELSFEKKFNLMCNASYISRAKYLIKELVIEKKVLDLEKRIEESVENSLSQSQKEFVLREKIKLIKKELGETDSKELDVNKFHDILSSRSYPEVIKNKLKKEINRYSLMNETSPELSIVRNYIDTVLNIPFNIKSKDVKDISKVKSAIDKTHYGMDEAKARILEYIAVKNINNSVTPIICLIGPPGVGKTTFAYSVASALNKEFAKISLGGLNDVGELIGHRRTYLGSAPGKIITSLIKAGTENPVILLDEVDKISKDYKGDPANALLDILDTEINKSFIDNFIEEEVDLSNVLFILTANDETAIPNALLDRLETIYISGYTIKEKILIAKNYLLEKILINSGLKTDSINISDKDLHILINNYTKESGVRELERILNKIIRKIILEYASNKKDIKKINLKSSDIEKYIGLSKYNINKENLLFIPGFVRGLGVMPYGGVVIEVEVTSFKGTGRFKYTGRLGRLTNESIEIVLSYIKSNHLKFGIKLEDLNKKDYHINFRNSKIIKEGSSAGVVIATSLISYLINKKVPNNVSLTGEMNLNGDITGVGGLKEKIIAASLSGINKIYVPLENKIEVLNIKEDIKEKIEFIFVSNYLDIYKDLFN